MTIQINAKLRRGIALILAKVKGKQWGDIVALQHLATEARALAKELQKTIPAPAPHEGPHSGKKPSEHSKLRNAAAAALRPLVDGLALLCKGLSDMSVGELQKIAASAQDTAFAADALLEAIGENPDPNAMISDLLDDRTIRKVIAKAVGKPLAHFDLATLAKAH